MSTSATAASPSIATCRYHGVALHVGLVVAVVVGWLVVVVGRGKVVELDG